MAKPLSQDLLAILDDNGVSERIRTFCSKSGVITPTDLGAACAEEKLIKDEILDATEYDDLSLGERKNVKKAWLSCRGRMNVGSAVAAVPAQQAVPKKMPDGAENRLRGLFNNAHGFNQPGAWLATERFMTSIYLGLNASPPNSHVPDIPSILRKSLLNQKPSKGTLRHRERRLHVESVHHAPGILLREQVVHYDHCFYRHPDPEFFSIETALDLVDYIFDAINCGPDGRRPSSSNFTSGYLAMFGDYAKVLQNEGTNLEAWLAFKGNWQHTGEMFRQQMLLMERVPVRRRVR